MVDAHALGACDCVRAGSNPASPTKHNKEGYSDEVAFRPWWQHA